MYIKNNIFWNFFLRPSCYFFFARANMQSRTMNEHKKKKEFRTIFATVTVEFLIHETSKSLFVWCGMIVWNKTN